MFVHKYSVGMWRFFKENFKYIFHSMTLFVSGASMPWVSVLQGKVDSKKSKVMTNFVVTRILKAQHYSERRGPRFVFSLVRNEN